MKGCELDYVTCGACGGTLDKVVAGGTCARQTMLARCSECGRSWVVEVTMLAYVGCGTSAGYQRHRRAGETPCGDCHTAHNIETAERKERAAKGLVPA